MAFDFLKAFYYRFADNFNAKKCVEDFQEEVLNILLSGKYVIGIYVDDKAHKFHFLRHEAFYKALANTLRQGSLSAESLVELSHHFSRKDK